MSAPDRTAAALDGTHLLLGVTGGIAAYKSAELLRRLQDQGATLQVVMTEAATRFVTATTFQALSGRPVFTSQWDERVANGMGHIDLSRSARAIVVAPASANFLAKLAHGLADDLLTTLCLARECPLVVAPAMNRQMWSAAATQRNVAQLRADGVVVLGPASGDQACGEVGAGRMLEPDDIVEEVVASFQPKCLSGRRVVVTAGPTFEPIDPVRGITNLSSGKMGYAIARAAREAGAAVTLVSGPTQLATPRGVQRIDVTTAAEMLHAVMAHIEGIDLFIGVAAVADWSVANPRPEKIKKGGLGPPALDFRETPDILATVAALPEGPFAVGFAAETNDLDANATAKRLKKKVPLIVGNLAHEAFGSDDNELVLYDAAGRVSLGRAGKLALARRLVGEIARRLPPLEG